MASTMAEIVYGTKEEGHVMSEKVSQLAASVYSEFEKMIKKYDEDVVKELMPLVVGILESLDQAYTEKQEADVDMELLREDNEQLLTQYEREKQLRKSADQKYLEAEDETEEYKKQMEDKVEFLESQNRMMELKIKNASDHATRMEDKEVELKKEYNKVHERYTELMRTHMDYMERAKMLMGSDRIADMANSPRSRGGFQLPNLKPVNMISMTGSTPLKSTGSPPDASAFDMMSPRSGKDSNVSLKSELSDLESPDINSNLARQVHVTTKTSDKEQNTDKVDVREFATATKTSGEKDGSSVVPPVSEESKDNVKSDSQTITDSESKTTNSSITESGTNPVAEINTRTSEEIESSDNKEKSQSELTGSVGVSVHDSGNSEKISENKEIDKVGAVDRTESSLQGASKSAVIDTGKSIDSSKLETVTEAKTMKTPTIKVQTENTIKSKVVDKATRLVPESPETPTSPLYDEGDFGFEEDAIPVVYKGLDDTIAHIVATTPELDDMEESMESSNSNNTSSKRNNASIFDELTIQDADIIGDVDFGADITDSEDEKEERNSNVSDNFFGMSRELENLILENTELLATKNALNIVKDDLIAKVDELTSEQEILKEEINTLKGQRTKLQDRIKELEDELKKTKEDLEKKVQAAQEAENEDDVPMAQRKRFTRVEMARVLMERNQYKERLMELQEAVRWTEMIRASREHPEIAPSKKKSSIWNFFGSLVSSEPPPPTPKKKNSQNTQIV